MEQLARFGVSLDARLLEQFDGLCERRGYASRSEAIRDLVRAALLDDAMRDASGRAAGVLTLVYDHHEGDLSKRLTAAQHDFHGSIVATLHVHLDHGTCLEILVLKGETAAVRALADHLLAMKGVRHGALALTPPGEG